MRHSNQLKSSPSLSLSREHLFSTYGGGRGDIGPSTTHFFTQKAYFGRTGMMGGFSHLSMIVQH